jgi:cell division protein FtsN
MSRLREIIRPTEDDQAEGPVVDAREDDLPWLDRGSDQADEKETPLIPRWMLFAGLGGFLLLLGVVTAGVYWYVTRDFLRPTEAKLAQVPDEQLPLIKAPSGPIKVRPDNPGGQEVPDQDKLVLEAATGNGDPAATPSALAQGAEQPMARPGTAPDPLVQPGFDAAPPPPVTKAPPPPAPKPAPPVVAQTPPPAAAPSGVLVQLGAFGSRERAAAAWKQLSAKHPQLGGLSPDYEVAGPGKVRLRAAGLPTRADADGVCSALRSAGQDCIIK